MIYQHLMRGSVLAAIVLITGCSYNAPSQRSGTASQPGAATAGYRSDAKPAPAYREGATPSGLSGFDNYDEPGQLPPNSGGTNAGRVGIDAR